MKASKTTKGNINQFLNLKFLLIESLKIQGARENWIYPALKSTKMHQIHFNN
jgi:hypothetical protein